MKTPRTMLLLLVLLALSPSVPAGPGEVVADLSFVVEEPRGYPMVTLPTTENPPAGVEAIPREPGARYFRRPLGTETLLLAARFWPEPSWIRVDRDLDGQVTDEEAIHFSGASTTVSATVEMSLSLDGEITEVPLRFIHHHQPGRVCLHLTVPVKKAGSVVLAGRLRPVALSDGDADLRFDGKLDGLRVDTNGDLELDPEEKVTPGEPVRIGAEGWTAVLTDSAVKFRRAEGEPPAPRTTWRASTAPRAGSQASGESTPLPKLEKEYAAAAKRDAAAGANRYTERSNVLSRVGRVGTEAAFRFLAKTYESESEPNLKAAAVRAMGYRQYAGHADFVVPIARNGGVTNLRSAAIQALHGMDAPGRRALLVELIRDAPDDSLFSQATRYLGYIATEEDRKLLEELARTESKPMRRRYAYEAAARYRDDPPPADLVRLAAQAEDAWHRQLGLEHAFRLALPDAHELALAALTSKDERVLKEAVRILGVADDAQAHGALLALAGPPPAVDRQVVTLLRAVRREETAATFVAALGDRRPEVRARAAAVLGGIPYAACIQALTARAKVEKDARVVTAILRALGEQDSEDATAAILEAAEAARKDPEALAAALDALAKLGLEDRKVRRFFERVLKSRDPIDRMLALEAAAGSGDLAAAPLLLDAVTDKDWRVRLVVAEGLGKVRVKHAVPVLIDRLEDEEMPRVRAAVEESLFRVTGQGYYDIVKLWRKWWAESSEAFEVPHEVPQRTKSGHRGASVASFYGVPVNSDRIIFVIDQSGSMSAAAGNMTKLERAVDETLKVVKKLRKGSRANVILFETSIHPWQKGLVKMTPGSKGMLGKHLRSKRPMGGTNLYDGLELALLTKGVDTIYLLSDGSPGSGKFVQHEDILREVRRLNRTRRVAIHCVAVGFDSKLMKDIAAQNGGQYVRR